MMARWLVNKIQIEDVFQDEMLLRSSLLLLRLLEDGNFFVSSFFTGAAAAAAGRLDPIYLKFLALMHTSLMTTRVPKTDLLCAVFSRDNRRNSSGHLRRDFRCDQFFPFPPKNKAFPKNNSFSKMVNEFNMVRSGVEKRQGVSPRGRFVLIHYARWQSKTLFDGSSYIN